MAYEENYSNSYKTNSEYRAWLSERAAWMLQHKFVDKDLHLQEHPAKKDPSYLPNIRSKYNLTPEEYRRDWHIEIYNQTISKGYAVLAPI